MIPLDREQEAVVVKHFSTSVDDYGQKHTEYSTRNTTMFIRKHTQGEFDDPRYNRVVLIGITKDASITDQDNILYKDKEYKVVYSIMSKRYNQYFMEIAQN